MKTERIMSYSMAHKLTENDIKDVAASGADVGTSYHFTFDSQKGTQDQTED